VCRGCSGTWGLDNPYTELDSGEVFRTVSPSTSFCKKRNVTIFMSSWPLSTALEKARGGREIHFLIEILKRWKCFI
jgi:hypothetical protein